MSLREKLSEKLGETAFEVTVPLPRMIAKRVQHFQGKDHDGWHFPLAHGEEEHGGHNVELTRMPIPDAPHSHHTLPWISLGIDDNVAGREELVKMFERKVEEAGLAAGIPVVRTTHDMEHVEEAEGVEHPPVLALAVDRYPHCVQASATFEHCDKRSARRHSAALYEEIRHGIFDLHPGHEHGEVPENGHAADFPAR